MNMSIEITVCVRRVFWKEGFWTTHRRRWISGASPSRLTKSVLGRTRGLTLFVCHDGDNVLNARVQLRRPWWYYEQSSMLCRAFLVFSLENETTVSLKSASFVVIMHLHEDLTHIQSQIKPWLLFGESSTLRLTGSPRSLIQVSYCQNNIVVILKLKR